MCLRCASGAEERLLKARIGGQVFEPAQFVQIDNPAIANSLGDGVGERGIGQQQPTPGCDAIGLIVETFREELCQVLNRDRSQQARMNRCHAVGAMRADNGHMCHADFLRFALLNETHAGDAGVIAGILRAHHVEEVPVDFVNDFKLARQHRLEPRQRPFLQRLG